MICAHCGDIIESPSWRQSYCCIACRKAAHADRVRSERQAAGAKPTTGHPCCDCGVNVIGKSIRCEPCKQTRLRTTTREWRREYDGHLAADTPKPCERCGTPITIGHHGRNKHCDACKRDALRVIHNRSAAAKRFRKLQDQISQIKIQK